MTSKARLYRLYPFAVSDLEDIWLYTSETWSLEQAERYHAGLVAAFEELASGRKQGRRTNIRDGYFKYAVGSHVVFFRKTDTGIDIVRVLHQRMDAERHL